MIKIRNIVLMATVAFVSTACTQPATNSTTGNANSAATANTNAGKPAPAPASKEAIVALEKQAWDAWKNNDPKFFDGFLSDRWVSFAGGGREDKAANIKRMTESKCEVKSYSLSDEQLHMLGADVAVLSFKAAQDATCGGTKIPASVWVSSAYVRDGDKWKALTYVENSVVDPNAPSANAEKPVKAAPAASAKDDGAAKPDALTEAVMAVETKAWDAWKSRDAKAMEAIMTPDFTYVGASGVYDRAGSLKTWSEPKCEGLAYTFSEPKAVSLTADVTLVTYKADVKGSCDGKPQPPAVWVASFNKKDGDAWKNAFYTDVPR